MKSLVDQIAETKETTAIEEAKSSEIIKELISSSFGGSNENQMKAVQLLKGLATSEEAPSNKFMKALDKWTSSLDPKDFE